jgi:hypothetical protein
MKESHIKESLPFFKTIWLALNPWRYDEVRDRTAGNAFRYFFSFAFLVFVLSIMLLLPTIGLFVNEQMKHFDRLEVSINTTMNSPVKLPANSPVVTLDTRTSEGQLKEGLFLVTDDYLYTKSLAGKVTRDSLNPYKNLLNNEGIVILILVLLLPSLLFLFYIGYVIKLLVIALLATIIGFIVTRIIKFEVSFIDTLKTGLFALTAMMIIDLIRLPFGLNVYFAQYIAFIIFFIMGLVKVGEFEGRGHKSRGKKSEYIDLGRKF